MTWAAYDGATVTRLTQQKTGAAMVIPCHPTLRAGKLDRWKANATARSDDLDQHARPANGRRSICRTNCRRTLAENWVAAGSECARIAQAGCRRTGRPADVRRTEIAAITGHRTLGMIELYTRSAVTKNGLAGSAVVKLAAWKNTQKR